MRWPQLSPPGLENFWMLVIPTNHPLLHDSHVPLAKLVLPNLGHLHPTFCTKMSLIGNPFLTSKSKIFPAGKRTRGMGKTVVVSLVSGFSPYRMPCQGHVSNRYKPWEASAATDPLNSIFWLHWCSDVLLGTALAPESLCSRLVSTYLF